MSDIKNLKKKRQKALDKAYHLQKQIEKNLNGQKFVLGGMLIAIAEHEPERIPQILADIDKYVTKKVDISRIEEFKSDLMSKTLSDSLEQPTELINRFEEYVTGINWSIRHNHSKPVDGQPMDDDIPF